MNTKSSYIRVEPSALFQLLFVIGAILVLIGLVSSVRMVGNSVDSYVSGVVDRRIDEMIAEAQAKAVKMNMIQ